MIWILGVKANNGSLKLAAGLLAVAFLLAATGSSSVADATVAASGSVVDWGGLTWANAAAKNFIEAIGGTAALARLFAAAGAIFAAVGFLGLNEGGNEGYMREEAIFSIGTY
jgi:hypothetical protein